MYKVIFLNIILIFSLSSLAQKQKEIKIAEQSIHHLFEELFLSDGTKFIQSDSTKLALSGEILKQLGTLLNRKESFKYPFDSLRRVGIRTSQDKKIRIFTWNIKLEKGRHLYYGFIQRKNGKKIQVFQLIDKSYQLPQDEIAFMYLDHKHWFGVNYYEIIDFKYRGKAMYALLGMRNNTYVSKTKVIEILSFSGKKAKFGKRVFKFDAKDDPDKIKKKQARILFEYNHKVSMILNYDKRYGMIVFDHLTPENSKLKDIKRFYGPDGSYDAFQFNTYKWRYIPDKWAVNKRNKKQEKLKTPQGNKTIYKSKN